MQDATVAVLYGGGQYWHPKYDPYDPLTLSDAHGMMPEPVKALVDEGRATAVLVSQGSIYPKGRVRPILLKGIDPNQKLLEMPTAVLGIGGQSPRKRGQFPTKFRC